MHHGALARVLFCRSLGILELLFEGREVGVLELCGLLILKVCLRALDLAVHLLDLALELLHAVHAALFGFPAGLHGVELLLLVGKLFLELFKTVA